MRHRATPRFWACYDALPTVTRQSADRCFALLRKDLRHPSLHFKKVGRFWSVRVGLYHRALAVESGADLTWVWIGSHAEYDRLTETSK
jgi:hypothetical protein